MKRIFFINACKTKTDKKGIAKEMYIGQFSEKAYRYASMIEHNKILFLSTVFHVVEPDQEISKVNKRFKGMSAIEKREWAKVTLSQIREKGVDVENDELIFLTPKNYWKWISEEQEKNGKNTANFMTPLRSLRQGEQLHWITEKLKEIE